MPSARCSAAQLVRRGGVLLPLALLVSFPAPGLAQSPWYEVAPATEAETSLRALVEQGSFPTAQDLLARVEAFSASHPGSVESGLARLWAGRKLLARGQAAAAQLAHEDVARTAIAEHAWLGLARARLRDDAYAEAAALFERVAARSGFDPTGCAALVGGADARAESGQLEVARQSLTLAVSRCPRADRAPTLLKLARNLEKLGELDEAARAYDRLDREHPVSPEAESAAARLAELLDRLPAQTPEERVRRGLAKARAQLRMGRAARAVGTLQPFRDTGPRLDEVRILVGRAEIARRRFKTAAGVLGTVPATSSRAAEAAFYLAVAEANQGRAVAAYEGVADRHKGTPWAERALFSLGNHFQKDAMDERAFPYYRRVLEEYGDGNYLIRATWRVGWREYRTGSWGAAASVFADTTRRCPDEPATGIFLYWEARAHLQLGAVERAIQLLRRVVSRFNHTYHGLKAGELLQTLGAPKRPAAPPATRPVSLPEPERTRYRQLVLIDMFDEAREELAALRGTRSVEATRAHVDALRGEFSSGMRAMSRAYPEYLGERGVSLPRGVWTTLFPLPFADTLVSRARRDDVDPALVAGLVRQESAFDAVAVSSAGARGLMQIMPATGRSLARNLGLRYTTRSLHDAETNLRLGIRYLRDLLRRFDGRVDHVLAAYNAGPHRVDQWKARYPDLTTEEFVETIPFTQTRLYVRNVLANREIYRRLYPAVAAAGALGDP